MSELTPEVSVLENTNFSGNGKKSQKPKTRKCINNCVCATNSSKNVETYLPRRENGVNLPLVSEAYDNVVLKNISTVFGDGETKPSYDIEKKAAADRSKLKVRHSDLERRVNRRAGGVAIIPKAASRKKGGADDGYDPFEQRQVELPLSDVETLIHLLKGSLGSGILAMPMAIRNAGLWFGIGATIVVGVLVTYCVHLLVKCAHILCRRRRIPMMGFSDVAEQAFRDGSTLERYAMFMRVMVDLFLVIDLLGCCCIYLVFVGASCKQVADFYMNSNINVRVWICIITIPLIFMVLIRNLKFLTPFSTIANILFLIGIIITLTYIGRDLPRPSEREAVASIVTWPLFFGTVIFALEGIGVVMSLENDMKNPSHFIGCPSILVIGMGIVISLYTVVGFFGYLKYGKDIKGSVTLNLPVDEVLAQSVKIMIAISIFFTFCLQFYVPATIIWRALKPKIAEDNQRLYEYVMRVVLVFICLVFAIALPNLGAFISLIGAICLSFLGIIIPASIELAVYRDDPGYGPGLWRLWKDCFLIIFGFIGCITGTYVSILEFVEGFSK